MVARANFRVARTRSGSNSRGADLRLAQKWRWEIQAAGSSSWIWMPPFIGSKSTGFKIRVANNIQKVLTLARSHGSIEPWKRHWN